MASSLPTSKAQPQFHLWVCFWACLRADTRTGCDEKNTLESDLHNMVMRLWGTFRWEDNRSSREEEENSKSAPQVEKAYIPPMRRVVARGMPHAITPGSGTLDQILVVFPSSKHSVRIGRRIRPLKRGPEVRENTLAKPYRYTI